MIVFVAENISLGEREFSKIAAIMAMFEDGLHNFGSETADIPQSLNSFLDRNPLQRELLTRELAAAAYRTGPTSHIRIVSKTDLSAEDDSALHLDLEAAYRYLGEPLWIFVENEPKDGHFYQAAIDAVAPTIGDAIRGRRAIRYQHGGGKGELRNIVSQRIDEMKHRGFPYRGVVFVDGDRKWPGDLGDNAGLEALANKAGFAFHALDKRAIENYLPDRVLQEYAAFSPDVKIAVNWFIGLSAPQRDHHPIKRPVKPEDLAKRASEARLYSDLGSHELFSHSLGGLMSYFVRDPFLSSSDLMERNAYEEISHLAMLIKENL